MITRTHLIHLRRNQQKEYYGSEAKAMFDNDGKFYPDNWNGGDAIIRQYFSPFRNAAVFLKQKSEEIDFRWEHGGFSGDIVASHHINHNDQSCATIVLDGHIDLPTWDGANVYLTHLVFHLSWYKDRGKTEIFRHSGLNTSDERMYLIMLNAIEATDFKFEIN